MTPASVVVVVVEVLGVCPILVRLRENKLPGFRLSVPKSGRRSLLRPTGLTSTEGSVDVVLLVVDVAETVIAFSTRASPNRAWMIFCIVPELGLSMSICMFFNFSAM